MSDFDANKDIHWWDRYFMSIMVCNLEVPRCWLEYGKASKSPREAIVFLRLLQYLNKCSGWILIIIINHYYYYYYLFAWCFCGASRIAKWVMVAQGAELLRYKPDPNSLGLSSQYLLNLGERRKAITGIRKQHLFKGKEWCLHLCGWGSFITFFVSEMNQF